MTELNKRGEGAIATYEEPIEFNFTNKNKKWDQAWLANHKNGNRLPRGKVFNAHRHLERRTRSQGLGKLIVVTIKSAIANSSKTSIKG